MRSYFYRHLWCVVLGKLFSVGLVVHLLSSCTVVVVHPDSHRGILVFRHFVHFWELFYSCIVSTNVSWHFSCPARLFNLQEPLCWCPKAFLKEKYLWIKVAESRWTVQDVIPDEQWVQIWREINILWRLDNMFTARYSGLLEQFVLKTL